MSAPKRTPKARPETVERRKEILRAAMSTFGSKGYKNGPLTEIAEQVDMTHAGILHHFGSKDQLLLEVLKYRDSSDVEDFAGQRIPNGVELFRHLIRTAFANERRPGIVQAYAVLSAESVTDDHPARDYFQERYRTLRQEIREAFELICRERGIDQPATVDRAAAAILAVMDGLQVQWLLDPENVELAEASAFAIEAVVAAVLGVGAGAEIRGGDTQHA
ncbi:TetR/AcrR family transcriptional regulator [Cellulomonas sp. RIT-PI-Y]|jgi:AcrR family transcriptional regulator|uniref:TetR/AcrR family transcriptional regulator n=1 Tax=Cellulomonas sp. RIT-PI-Y TaxID=3035297 RepID=UPI0021D9D58F|nr:TetR/AcrR family transcriptional regulator [Cellulomonas sp. RIT-PI-Y]